jgi:NADH-quinone oxidoreductase subunit C
MADVDADADADAGVETVHGAITGESCGQQVLFVERAQLVDVVRALCDDDDFRMALDVTAVDYTAYDRPRRLPEGIEPGRFELVVVLLSMSRRQRVRIRVQVPEDDPVVPSLFEVHPGTEAMEREVFDMFGIRFDGHPDLTRILMPEDWSGHPLRKDFAIGKIPVQFKGVSNVR